jgi:hypothetical protein
LACSSAIAAFSCGTEALMLGSLMMLASGSSVFLPSSVSVSGTRCSGLKLSGNWPSTRAATEMSLVSTRTPAGAAKARITGRNATVNSSGASSVSV